jgi:hypothetical protein
VSGAINTTGGLRVSPSATTTTSTNSYLLDNPLYIRSDTYHGLIYGNNLTAKSLGIDGPFLFGYGGGVLGTTATRTAGVLYWNSASQVGIGIAPTYNLDVSGNCRLGGTGNSALIGSSTGLLVQGYAGADCYIRTNGGAGTQTGGIYFGAGATNTVYFSSTGSLSNASTTSNNIGGVILNNSVISSPAATNLQITTPVGYNLTINPVNQLIMSGNVASLTSGTTITLNACNAGNGIIMQSNGTTLMQLDPASSYVYVSNAFCVNKATSGSGSGNFVVAGLSYLPYITASGVNTNPVQIQTGLILSNGYRPLYQNVSSSSAITPSASTYGTHYYITNSAVTGITIPAPTFGADLDGYWVFRNATGSYLSITVTWPTSYYPSVGGTLTTMSPSPSTNLIPIAPQNSITIMFVYTSGVVGNYCAATAGTASGSNLYAVF